MADQKFYLIVIVHVTQPCACVSGPVVHETYV